MKEEALPVRRLLELIDRLRGEDGCPWDRAQTLETLQPYLLDETCEVLAAINSLDGENLAEELGDLLFHVLMVCRAAAAEKSITLTEIAAGVEAEIASGDRQRREEEMGDLLFSVVNLTRQLGLDAETTLQRMINRWVRRFQRMEKRARGEGRELKELTLKEMDRLWEEVKDEERREQSA